MKINWKLRIKNKTTLLALITCIIGVVYQILGILGVTPPTSEEQVMQIVNLLLNVLVMVGVVVDPTTAGINDSAKALQYTEPN
ncbi:MAG: phage holin [Aminipila sp.]